MKLRLAVSALAMLVGLGCPGAEVPDGGASAGGSVAGGSAGGSVAGGSAGGGSVAGGSAGGGSVGGGSVGGGLVAGGSVGGGSVAGGSVAGGSVGGGSVAGGSVGGGSVGGGSVGGGSVGGGSVAGGSAGGLVFDGGTPWLNGHLATLALGQWLDVSSSTNVGPIVDTTGPSPAAWLESAANQAMNNWAGKMTYDAVTQQVIVTGSAEGYISEVPSGAHSMALFFDLATGQFSKTWNPVGASLGHIYDANCSRPLGGFIYRRPFNDDRVFRMNVLTRQWSSLATLTSLNLGNVVALDVFPTMGAQGSLVFVGTGGKVGRYDLATGTPSVLAPTLAATGSYLVSSYFSALDAVVVGGGFGGTGSALSKLDASGTLTPLVSTLPPGVPGIGPNSNFTLLFPDPNGAARAYLVDAPTTGKVYTLELATGAWTELGPVPAALMGTQHLSGAVLRGAGVILFFRGRGRANSMTNLSQVFLLRVD